MDKKAYENLAVLLDLNTIGMLKLLQANSQDLRSGVAFGLEDIIEQVVYAINAGILQNSANKVALFIFDEVESDLIFPTNASDSYLIEIMDFGHIKRTIFDRVMGHLRNKQPVDKYHSRFVSALYKTVCCELTRPQLDHRQAEVQGALLESPRRAELGYQGGGLLQPHELRPSSQKPRELTRTSSLMPLCCLTRRTRTI